jgi:hypothetical protein
MPGLWRWFVSLADKYSAESGIPAEFYYALFRAWVPTDADGMHQTSSEKVKSIWANAEAMFGKETSTTSRRMGCGCACSKAY